MPKKIIAFDLDGTLLNSQKKITQKSKEIIKTLHNRGHQFIIATARPLTTTNRYVTDLQVPVSIILQNGACYLDPNNNLISNYIENEIFIEIVEYIQKSDANSAISIMNNDQWLTFSDFNFKSYYNVDFGPIKMTKTEIYKSQCTKILVNNCTIGKKIKSVYENLVNIIETDNQTLVQIMNKNASKEAVIKKMLEAKNDTEKNLLCFGDDHNDIGMFKLAGHSVAMGNSINELKEIANYITDTNDNEGIYKYFISSCWAEIEEM